MNHEGLLGLDLLGLVDFFRASDYYRHGLGVMATGDRGFCLGDRGWGEAITIFEDFCQGCSGEGGDRFGSTSMHETFPKTYRF
ncbi:MAG: hypothetical protein SXA11_14760 [Cyanobacteriota bacterium]|nr:hypothetical protein [Cyanobacteriota bacterium]